MGKEGGKKVESKERKRKGRWKGRGELRGNGSGKECVGNWKRKERMKEDMHGEGEVKRASTVKCTFTVYCALYLAAESRSQPGSDWLSELSLCFPLSSSLFFSAQPPGAGGRRRPPRQEQAAPSCSASWSARPRAASRSAWVRRCRDSRSRVRSRSSFTSDCRS
jgi:hypothetical protein